MKLERKIQVKGYQVRTILYTTKFLLENAETVTKLCIKSKEEYRLWRELKRTSFNVDIKTKGKTDVYISSFKIEGVDISINNNEIAVSTNQRSYTFSKEDFNKKPRSISAEILKIMRKGRYLDKKVN